jgi:D-alanyl-lipoteichoic acid acyltransferase DltB (MBOAT superfamily)
LNLRLRLTFDALSGGIVLFNSYEFIFLFLPIVFLVYFYLNSKRLIVGGRVWLVLSSLFFYSFWNPVYLPLMLFSMSFNFTIGLAMVNLERVRQVKFAGWVSKKQLLILGIAGNLGLLGYFKYMNFFIGNFNLAFNAGISPKNITLPLAISFFTFNQITYIVDIYKGRTEGYDLLRYVLFVTFFPHLIAGPLVHYKEMMPQFASKWNLVKNYRNIALGLALFSIGLFKKVIIADTFAVWATNGFDKAEVLNFFEAWVTSLSYTFQIYFDFSGYTDMALGASLLFNIKLPVNFNSPYKATNIQEFWKRWHMTLSRFLRDYIYIPLGGSHTGKYRIYINLMVTFLLGGIWHGASWMFVLWGSLHGLAMIIHRMWSNLGLKTNRILGWIITFNFVNLSWIFFRARAWDDVIKIVKGMLGFNGIVMPRFLAAKLAFLSNYGVRFKNGWMINIEGSFIIIIYLFLAYLLVSFFEDSNSLICRYRPLLRHTLAISILLTIAIISLTSKSEFLYFNF